MGRPDSSPSLDTYAEVSPSGRGVKLVCRGRLRPGPDGRTRHKRVGLGPDRTGSVELYDGRRFFTLTGRPLPGRSGDRSRHVAARQRVLDALCLEWFPPPRPVSRRPFLAVGTADDESVLAAARAAGGVRFVSLWAGDAAAYGGDRSARDAALCASLARHTRDPDQIARLVGRSGCGERPKWSERPDYRERTIRFALRLSGP